MSARVFVPADSSALSVGADARRGSDRATKRAAAALDIAIVRTGSRGLFWLEPLVEVETAAGRIGYGPVAPGEAARLFEAGFLTGGAHPKALGRVDDIPYLARQQRLVFARCGVTDPLSLDDYRRHGGLRGPRARADARVRRRSVEEVFASGLRGRGGAGFPTGIKWRTAAGADADQKYVVCNADEGDSGTFADRMLMEGDPFLLIEGMAIAGARGRRDDGLRLHPLRISARLRDFSSGRSSARGPAGCSARACSARATPSTSRRGSAPAPISAARRPRCSKASRASAARCAPSRRCRRSPACSASRPSSTTC